jgi:hypothetical protein
MRSTSVEKSVTVGDQFEGEKEQAHLTHLIPCGVDMVKEDINTRRFEIIINRMA